MRSLYVYIMASRSRVLYTGVTNNLGSRVSEHGMASPGTFTARYRITRLVYFEIIAGPRNAIAREKQIKSWSRQRRVALIQSVNPKWRDLAKDWFIPPAD